MESLKAFVCTITLFEIVVVWSMGLLTYAVKVQNVALVTALLVNLGAVLYARIKGQQ